LPGNKKSVNLPKKSLRISKGGKGRHEYDNSGIQSRQGKNTDGRINPGRVITNGI